MFYPKFELLLNTTILHFVAVAVAVAAVVKTDD